MTGNPHSAAGPTLGYLFQTQWPLIDLVRRARLEPDCRLVLEMADDVEWVDERCDPKELVQSKHHTRTAADLGDKSTDLWRTIAVWLDTGRPTDADGPSLTLLTTAVAAPGTAAHALCGSHRDPATAQGLLEAAAVASASRTTADARAAFLRLGGADRAAFVSRMTVRDGAPQVHDLDAQLLEELGMVVPLGHEATFLALVWDWWIRVAVQLLRRDLPFVSGLELRGAIDDLRDRFTENNLPTLVSRESFDSSSLADYETRVFVHQLNWVEPPPAILQKAVQDYYRAVTQSAQWIEADLVAWPEVRRFQDDLRDEWERAFSWMADRLPVDATPAQKVEAGRRLLEGCLATSEIHIRERYREPFYFRGKLHQLADEHLVGWHPDFQILLDDLLAAVSA